MNMIEKVAKVLFEILNQRLPIPAQYENLHFEIKLRLNEMAKAAIEAMREPTEEMEAEAKAMNKLLGLDHLNVAMTSYKLILKTALKE